MFQGYNPRDIQKTLLLVTADIEKRKAKKKGIPPHIVSFRNILMRHLAEEKTCETIKLV